MSCRSSRLSIVFCAGLFALGFISSSGEDVLFRVDQIGAPSAYVAPRASITDDERNVLVAWTFNKTADFYPRNGSELVAPAKGNVIVTKIGRDGKLKWYVQFGSWQISQGLTTPSATTLDTSGNITIVGQFTGSADALEKNTDMGPGESEEVYTSVGDGNGMILRLNVPRK